MSLSISATGRVRPNLLFDEAGRQLQNKVLSHLIYSSIYRRPGNDPTRMEKQVAVEVMADCLQDARAGRSKYGYEN